MRSGRRPRGAGVLGELIIDPVPLQLWDVDDHPRSYGFPLGHPPMRSFLGVPVLVGGEPYGNLYLTEKQGAAEFTAEDEEAVVLLAEFAGVAIDHARRYTGSERRRAELQGTVNALEATIEIARALGWRDQPRHDPGAGRQARARAGVRTGARDRARARRRARRRRGRRNAARGPRRPTARASGTRSPARPCEPVSLSGWPTSSTARALSRFGLGQFGLTPDDGLVVPLLFRGRTYGALVAIDRLDGGRFTTDHQRLLEAFAASAATAVATAQSAADERRRQTLAAAEAERGRWARELHDETLQSLAALRLHARRRTSLWRIGSITEIIDEAVEQLEADIANLRGLIADLRPAEIEELGAEAAINALAERFEAKGLAVDVSVERRRRAPRYGRHRHPPDL